MDHLSDAVLRPGKRAVTELTVAAAGAKASDNAVEALAIFSWCAGAPPHLTSRLQTSFQHDF